MGCKMLSITMMLSWSLATADKYIASMPIPIEWVRGDSATHSFINEQGRKILFNDGHKKAFQFFQIFAEPLDSGVLWVDTGLKSTCHLYDPDTQSGMWFWPSAAEKCTEFYNKARKLWQQKKHDKAIFYLGAAIHLVQDMCVPHHAACKIFGSHMDFEDWAESHKDHYKVTRGGIYDLALKPEEWIAENARLAKAFYPLVEDGARTGYHQAAEILLPQAQRTTAGFLLQFYNQLKGWKGDTDFEGSHFYRYFCSSGERSSPDHWQAGRSPGSPGHPLPGAFAGCQSVGS